jgi:FkbM family methyltransferase
MGRLNTKSDSYEALLWDVVTNAHRYTPRRGDRVLDLGAHFGMFSLYCAARGATVWAMEPASAAYAELQHSARVAEEIGNGRILPINVGVWSKEADLIMRICPETTGSNSVVRLGKDTETTESVQVMPLQHALGFSAWWDCVKIDIEGAEHEAICAGDVSFDNVRFLTIEIHNDILSVQQCKEVQHRLWLEFTNMEILPLKSDSSIAVALFCSRKGGKR